MGTDRSGAGSVNPVFIRAIREIRGLFGCGFNALCSFAATEIRARTSGLKGLQRWLLLTLRSEQGASQPRTEANKQNKCSFVVRLLRNRNGAFALSAFFRGSLCSRLGFAVVVLAIMEWGTTTWAAAPSNQAGTSNVVARFYRVKLKPFPTQPTDAGNAQNAATIRIEEPYFRDAERTYGGSAPEAIIGDGFFQVQLPDGTQAYTRDGNFKFAGNGLIVTQEGYPVLGGLPLFPPSTRGVIFSSQGEIALTTAGGGVNVGRITLTRFQNPADLKPIGSNLFVETLASGPPETGNPGENGFGELGGGFFRLPGSVGFTVRLSEQGRIEVEFCLDLRDWTVVASAPVSARGPLFAGGTLIVRDLQPFAGGPTTAGTLIDVDVSEALKLFGRRLPDGRFSVSISGSAASNAVLQASTNLVNWLPIFTNSGSGGRFEFLDTASGNQPWRFHRAIR